MSGKFRQIFETPGAEGIVLSPITDEEIFEESDEPEVKFKECLFSKLCSEGESEISDLKPAENNETNQDLEFSDDFESDEEVSFFFANKVFLPPNWPSTEKPFLNLLRIPSLKMIFC